MSSNRTEASSLRGAGSSSTLTGCRHRLRRPGRTGSRTGVAERGRDRVQPARLGTAVVIGECHHRPVRRRQAAVSGPRRPRLLAAHVACPRIPDDLLGGPIRRCGVHDDQLILRPHAARNRRHAVAQHLRAVAGRHDDADAILPEVSDVVNVCGMGHGTAPCRCRSALDDLASAERLSGRSSPQAPPKSASAKAASAMGAGTPLCGVVVATTRKERNRLCSPATTLRQTGTRRLRGARGDAQHPFTGGAFGASALHRERVRTLCFDRRRSIAGGVQQDLAAVDGVVLPASTAGGKSSKRASRRSTRPSEVDRRADQHAAGTGQGSTSHPGPPLPRSRRDLSATPSALPSPCRPRARSPGRSS